MAQSLQVQTNPPLDCTFFRSRDFRQKRGWESVLSTGSQGKGKGCKRDMAKLKMACRTEAVPLFAGPVAGNSCMTVTEVELILVLFNTLLCPSANYSPAGRAER